MPRRGPVRQLWVMCDAWTWSCAVCSSAASWVGESAVSVQAGEVIRWSRATH